MDNFFYNDFYFVESIENKENNEFVASVKLEPNHPIYEGHFPNSPVTPGVCIIQIIKEILSDFVKKTLVLKASDNIKFINMIDPRQVSTLYFQFKYKDIDNHAITTECTILDSEKIYVKFKGNYSENKV